MIDQGVTVALAARDADRNINGDDCHNSGTGVLHRRSCRSILNGLISMELFSTSVILGHDAAYGMPWKTLMKMMTDKYYPRNEIKKLEMDYLRSKGDGSGLEKITPTLSGRNWLCYAGGCTLSQKNMIKFQKECVTTPTDASLAIRINTYSDQTAKIKLRDEIKDWMVGIYSWTSLKVSTLREKAHGPHLPLYTCGVNLLLGTCLNCTYGDGKPVTCCGCEGPLKGGFCSFCASRDGNSFDYNPNPNSFNESQNFSDYPPQPQYETNICELCGNDAHFGYDCSLQVPFVYNPDPCFDQNYDNNFPLTSPNFSQQYLCCENCGGPHENFQCQPLNQNFYEPNHCYNSNFSGFDQLQPPQFSVIHHPPQATDTEMLQARENLMETIQAFLKEYDHIPPEEKCMALLLAEERFLKIKQAVEEEQNQPEFSRIPFGEIPKVLLIAWERFSEIKHAFTDKQYQQEDIQELMSKLLEDVRNINEELSEFINSPSWNRPTFYNDDDEYTVIYRKPKEITPDLPIEEPDNSLSMGDEHLNTIPEMEKSSVENLVPIPSEFKGISEDICDVPSCDNDHFDAECGLINSLLSRDCSITSP
ncbi:hypothetical protein Tco_0353504 [Tanacetum coccineum]